MSGVNPMLRSDLDHRGIGNVGDFPVLYFHAERWTLFNLDRVHTLTVVWNKADDGYWKEDTHKLTNIINTLKITPSKGK